jgi:hypothetical protein
MKRAFGLLAAFLLMAGPAVAQTPIAVDVANKSTPTKCAEEDNVFYAFSAEKIAGFRLTAESPSYLPTMMRDITAPDFSGCPWWKPAPPKPYEKPYVPPTAVLYEDDQYIVKGVVYPDFWRPSVVPVTVGNLKQNFLHLVQVWKKTAGGPLEFLVMYPQDGYWRLKPLPPFRLHEVTYGSSFLVGPVEESTRPFTAYKSVEFVPETLTFNLEFEKGGKATVRIAELDVDRAALDIAFDPPLDGKLPFTAVRSMYVDPIHADTAEVVTTAEPGGPLSRTSVIDYKSGKAASVVFGRSVPSTHNTSAPDIGFEAFRK